MMKAATYQRYGPPSVVEITDVPKPTARPGEVLIRVRSACVNSADCRLRSNEVPRGFGLLMRIGMGIFGPRQPVLGTDLAGVIEAIGKGVTRFKEGDEVFGDTSARLGAHAEYALLDCDAAITAKPKSLPLREAAAIPFGGVTALCFVRDKAKVAPGERVLINGASGAVGCAAVQIAKHLGAHVTAVCSGGNADLVLSLGADEVIDYAIEDFAESPATYDVIMDNVGNAPWARTKRRLNPGGRLLCVVATLPQMIGALWPKGQGKKVICGMATADAAILDFLSELIDAGHYKPVIDQAFPLERIAEAYAYCDTGRKKGSVVIDVCETAEE